MSRRKDMARRQVQYSATISRIFPDIIVYGEDGEIIQAHWTSSKDDWLSGRVCTKIAPTDISDDYRDRIIIQCICIEFDAFRYPAFHMHI
jgi:hypothetical protein